MNPGAGACSSIVLGTAGEYLACVDLILKGFPAFPASQGLPYDVVMQCGTRLIRVAVRSTRCPRRRSSRHNTRYTYQFHSVKTGGIAYSDKDADLLAFVALDRRMVAYAVPGWVPNVMHLDIPGEPIHYPNRTSHHKGGRKFEAFTFDAAMTLLFGNDEWRKEVPDLPVTPMMAPTGPWGQECKRYVQPVRNDRYRRRISARRKREAEAQQDTEPAPHVST